MRRNLTQVGCILRPRSVDNADMALRFFAASAKASKPGCAAQEDSGKDSYEPCGHPRDSAHGGEGRSAARRSRAR